MDNWQEWDFLDIISILSFIIGLENLELNNKQVNSLEEHLHHQDNNLLAKIIQQNEELIELDKQIIELLKEKKYEDPNKTN